MLQLTGMSTHPPHAETDYFSLLSLLEVAERTYNAQEFLFMYMEESKERTTDSRAQLMLRSYETVI